MLFLIISAVALGIWAAFFLVGYAMIAIEDPYDRVAFLWTILATDVTTLALATFLFEPFVATVLFSCLLTKCLVWSIMNHRNIVHYQYVPKE